MTDSRIAEYVKTIEDYIKLKEGKTIDENGFIILVPKDRFIQSLSLAINVLKKLDEERIYKISFNVMAHSGTDECILCRKTAKTIITELTGEV